jgi:hypothetical protein
MATIVIHAGMPKTGSTSIQRWISRNSRLLLHDHDMLVVVANPTGPYAQGDIRLQPYKSGRVNSGPLVTGWIAAQRSPAFPRRFVDELARFADEHSTVLVTAEALAQPIVQADDAFLLSFEELARRHEVRIAIYVRPQHSAIEARWCEGGYKQEHEPSQWVRNESLNLHYLRTVDAVRELAPNIDLGVRPFRRDLLQAQSVVCDFVARFLGLEVDADDVLENPGLPLTLVNMLRQAPEGSFWRDNRLAENFSRARLREIFDGVNSIESPKATRSRDVLQAFCHHVFELENLELIRRLEWPAADFVPARPELEDDWDLSELDRLWSPDASNAELAYMFRALQRALTTPTLSTAAANTPNVGAGGSEGRVVSGPSCAPRRVPRRVARAIAIGSARVKRWTRSVRSKSAGWYPRQPGG